MVDAAHIKAPCCTRARANSTMRNIGKAFVQNGTAFVQTSTIRCNARALFSIVLNQYNQEQLTLQSFARYYSVSLGTGSDKSDTKQNSSVQRYTMQDPPPPLATPLPLLL